MAIVKVKLLEAHYDKDGRYLASGTVVSIDDKLLNTSQIPAPGLGAETTTATSAFGTNFNSVTAPIPGQPNRFVRK